MQTTQLNGIAGITAPTDTTRSTTIGLMDFHCDGCGQAVIKSFNGSLGSSRQDISSPEKNRTLGQVWLRLRWREF